MEKIAVLLMAYGTPNVPDEIEPYYTDIRGGRKPSPENLKELVARYQQIGGRTPLLDITREQARATIATWRRISRLRRNETLASIFNRKERKETELKSLRPLRSLR